MTTFSEIIIPQKFFTPKQHFLTNLSATLTYQNPDNLQPGTLVEIPLRNRITRGLIFQNHHEKPSYTTKSIIQPVTNVPTLQPYQLQLIKFISEHYFSPYHKIVKLFIPAGFFQKKQIKAGIIRQSTAAKQSRLTAREELHQLSPAQQQAFQQISSSNSTTILLHGITGSGKTEIYRHLTQRQIQTNRQTLILVPEISLTPQTVQYFERKFGDNIAIIHSQLTPKQKETYWQQIANNDLKIIIGSRSAIFAPFANLGQIIIDEEHEDSYKQEQSPRYHTHQIAIQIARQLDIQVILGSATPSIESYYQAQIGNYHLVSLGERVHQKNQLPPVDIVDLREELKKNNYSIFSELLQQSITANLSAQQQCLLFINRRGAASAIICRDCGHLEKCPHCEIAYTFHNKISLESTLLPAERMICHHCGKIAKLPSQCPNCQSPRIKHIGIGTQKVEDHVKQQFAQAKVIRADRDTTKTKSSFDQIYHDFQNQRYNVLVGTQMIAKGLHLPRITLVGVILADTQLTIPDYRSAEKTFQILTQVAGRAGRESSGKVIVQTYLPEHYAIRAAQNHDYHTFYQREIQFRSELNYPPFTRIIKLTITTPDQQKTYYQAQDLHQKLLTHLEQQQINDLQINSYPALLHRFKKKYHWNILLTGNNPRQVLRNFALQYRLPDDIKIDVDPVNTA